MTRDTCERLGRSGVLVLAILLSNCADKKSTESYVKERIKAIKTEPLSNLSPNGKGARTLRYWQTADGLVRICSDIQRAANDSLRSHVNSEYIGSEVTDALRRLPTAGIDKDAIKSIQVVADRFDSLRPLDKALILECERVGFSLGYAAAKAVGQALDNGAFDPDNPDAGSALLDAAGKLKVSGFAGIKAASLKLSQQEQGIDAYLEATRKALSRRYRADFPNFSVINEIDHTSGYCTSDPTTSWERFSNLSRVR
jgi:hypothetical protein